MFGILLFCGTLALDKTTTNITLGLVTVSAVRTEPNTAMLAGIVLLSSAIFKMFPIFMYCLGAYCKKVKIQMNNRIKKFGHDVIIISRVILVICMVLTLCELIILSTANISLSVLEGPMLLSLDLYSLDPELTKDWVHLQVGYKCCGVHNYSDWFQMSNQKSWNDMYHSGSTNNVPTSCCKRVISGCGQNISNAENIYETGCLKSIGIHIRKQVPSQMIVHGSIIVILFVQFVFQVGFFKRRPKNEDEHKNDDNHLVENNEQNGIKGNIDI